MAPPAVLLAVATGVAGAGAIVQGQAARSAAQFEAEQRDRQAKIVRQNVRFEERRLREQLDLVLGSQRAAAAGQGLLVDAGSPLEILARTAEDAELDIRALRRAGTIEEQNQLAAAAAARLRGRAGETASFFRAGASVLTGGSRVAELLGDGPEPED